MRQSGTARERHFAQNLSGAQGRSRRLGLSSVIFRPITLISLILIGCFAFGALIVLGGFAEDLRKAPPGQATPRSVSAVGYKAFNDYLERLDYDIKESRGKRDYYDRKNRLVIYSPSRTYSRLKKTLDAKGDETSLVILPKWSVTQFRPQRGEEGRKDWARKTRGSGLMPPGGYRNMTEDLPVIRRSAFSSPDTKLSFETVNTRTLSENYTPDFQDLQYFDLNARWPDFIDELREEKLAEIEAQRRKRAEERGETYEPKKKKKDETKDDEKTSDKTSEEDEEEEVEPEPEPLPNHEVLLKIDGHPVLIRLEDTETYILSEPDLVNTMAFNSQGGAQIANAIVDDIIAHADINQLSVDIDVSLHGIQSNQNIVKLMMTPPFLAATLCLLAAGILVAWQGFNRFGDPARVRPDYRQGPVSLARTAAEFMGIANRAHHTGEDYAELIRRQVASYLGYRERAHTDIDKLLDAREKRLKIQPPFSDLKHAISGADQQSYGQYARALTTWRDAMTKTALETASSLSDS